MPANEIKCDYCQQNIVWSEIFGWLVSTDEFRFGVTGSEKCYGRPTAEGGPANGHSWTWPEGDKL